MNDTVNIIRIIRGTTVDGPGFRTSIYFAGCHHKCEGCHNPESWDFNNGTPMTLDEICAIIREEDFDVTLTGGDPLYNPEWVVKIAKIAHELNHTIWIYTGYRWEEICENPLLLSAVSECDVAVDSPFMISLRDTDLLFRGSSNQRIIDIRKTMESNAITLWERRE